MINKRIYNNLFDSICMTILLFICLVWYFLILWFGVINANEKTDPIVLFIISSVFFGAMIIITTFLIIKFCYGYWVLSDDSIIFKKLFCKRIQTKLTGINKVEQKTIPALILGIYKSKAYIIHSDDIKIVILIKEKKHPELDFLLAKFIDNTND